MFHLEQRNGLRELTAFTERWRLATGDFAHLNTNMTSDYIFVILVCKVAVEYRFGVETLRVFVRLLQQEFGKGTL